MRNGQQHHHNKRMRGRNNNNNNNNRRSHNPLTRVYESNGPDVKIRGTANHVAEKYLQLARDAQSSGDPVSAENYFQHAEHYFRLIAAAQEQFRQNNPNFQPRPEGGGNDQQFQPRQEEGFEGDDDSQPFAGAPFGTREPQPYIPQNAQPFVPRDAQPYQPREQHDAPPHDARQEGRQDARQDGRQDGRQDARHDLRQEARHDARQEMRHQPRPPQPQPPHDGGHEALPAFITGAAPQPQPQQNGYENGGQPDRFPLHRRRRRHRGPRSDMHEGTPQGGGAGPDDSGA